MPDLSLSDDRSTKRVKNPHDLHDPLYPPHPISSQHDPLSNSILPISPPHTHICQAVIPICKTQPNASPSYILIDTKNNISVVKRTGERSY